ncbi:hypothetical protein ACJX0J_028311 [Zea mays]
MMFFLRYLSMAEEEVKNLNPKVCCLFDTNYWIFFHQIIYLHGSGLRACSILINLVFIHVNFIDCFVFLDFWSAIIPIHKTKTYKIFFWLDASYKVLFMEFAVAVAVVVAHELAHQWFGNFVTMEWWTHMWLNEGFATWVSYLAADQFFPEWNVWTQFLEESTIGFKLDALAGSHPIEAANIITLYDVSSIWRIPLLLHEQKAHEDGQKAHEALIHYFSMFTNY